MTISASILNSDLCNIESTVRLLEKNNIKMLHFDVMDGIFVDNISFGLPVLQSIKRVTNIFLDVHLMIVNPMRHIPKFADAGADLITFHLEACENYKEAEKLIETIHACGIKAGVAIRPATSAYEILRFVEICDLVLLMSVDPGFGGQKFILETSEKLKLVSDFCNNTKRKPFIQVDGGINKETAKIALQSGANNLVSGTYLLDALKKGVKNYF